jgi:3',5'-cyclic AMP phosphodiesterase CpdA
MKKLLVIVLIFLVLGCDSFEFSPNQIFDRDTPRDINAQSLKALNAAPVDDTVTIALVGDSQRWFDELDYFVEKVNQYDNVDFILLDGDISDFGLLAEFEWVHRTLKRLKKPYLGVIGNHDVLASGEQVFTRMYGPLDYSFVYDSIKFVVHNTNGREYKDREVPNMTWLAEQFSPEQSPDAKYFIGVAHVPPDHPDFDQRLVEPYRNLFNSTPGFLVSLNAHVHKHSDGYPFNDGVRYITAHSFNLRSFVILKIVNGQIIKEIINY